MSVIFSLEELTAMDRKPLAPDLGLISLGDEFDWHPSESDVDVSDLQCHPLLASDLPLNSELHEASASSPM